MPATAKIVNTNRSREFNLHFTYEELNVFLKTFNLNTQLSHISKRQNEIVL